MGKTMCPGQDTAFWRPGDIFEVQCSGCGQQVEFFKDDGSRRCPSCGQRVQNPKLNLGCAQWCEHAKECLGYDPKEAGDPEAGQETLVDQLLAAIKNTAGSAQLALAVARLESVKKLAANQPDLNPKVLFTAALLQNLPPEQSQSLLQKAGLDPETSMTVEALLEDHQSTPEGQILSQAMEE